MSKVDSSISAKLTAATHRESANNSSMTKPTRNVSDAQRIRLARCV